MAGTEHASDVRIQTLLDIAWARRAAAAGVARAIREAAGVSIHDCARALGVGANTISRWETGNRIPRGELAVRWAALLRELANVGGGRV